ncbi:hypothetical protein CGMCC3_g9618 [Colletotrichum fructicola]|nr:uncharacterized protein CGMCC3_g9618 [Colletotrichum fructicola]KAE9574525.1 hypothetical protein CGMCC3_g9618 [Colletotrichum fructicola]
MRRFHPVHALPLLLATTFTIGGAMPLWNPSGAIREFGLPEHIQTSTEAQSAWKIYGIRMSLWGVAMWTFFLRGNFEALDTMMSLFVGMGAVDGYVCYCEGVPGQGLFRFGTSVVLGLWGVLGVNSRFARA